MSQLSYTCCHLEAALPQVVPEVHRDVSLSAIIGLHAGPDSKVCAVVPCPVPSTEEALRQLPLVASLPF